MVTDRDRLTLDWLEKFRQATAEQLNRIAYNNMPICWKRLRRLYDDGLLYRERNVYDKGYIYSTNRIRTTKQFAHDYIRNEFYFKLAACSKIDTCMVEKVFGSIRPDGVFEVERNGEYYFFLLEVETNANRSTVNYDKYNTFFLKEWQKHFDYKPVVVYVTDKKIDDDRIHFDYTVLSTKLTDFTHIFR